MSKSKFLDDLVRQSADKLHHLSMRYSGALMELGQGKAVGLIAQGTHGLREARDLIDLILLTRAETNGLTKLLIDAKVLKLDDVRRQFAEEYEWLANHKAAFLGVEVNEHGIVFRLPKEGDQ